MLEAVRLQVFGLGFVSVFDQVLEGLAEGDKEALFKAYISSLDENAEQYRAVRPRKHLQSEACCVHRSLNQIQLLLTIHALLHNGSVIHDYQLGTGQQFLMRRS